MTGAAGGFACVSPSKRSSVGTIALADRLNRVRELVPLSERVIARATGTDETTAPAWMDRRDLERDANIYWAFGPPGKFARDTDPHDDRRFIQRRPTLAVEPDGTVWCAWEDGRLSSQRVFFTHSKDPKNVPLGDAKEGGMAAPSLAAGGGKVAIAYQSGDSVGYRILK